MTAPIIVATGDWHGQLPDLPEGDILVIAGDTLPVWNHDRAYQSRWTKDTLIPHLGSLPFDDILIIGGNHDFLFMESKKWVKLLPENIQYLEDESVLIDGINFHGSPWANRFGNWAFMLDENDLRNKWSLVPDDTDVFIVHGPPFGACDFTSAYGKVHAGSKTLRERIVELRVPLVITGHIHEGYGTDQIGSSLIENVSLMDGYYNAVNEPRVVTIPEKGES